MRPQFSINFEELLGKLALDQDRHRDARASAGLESRADAPDIAPKRRGPVAHKVPDDVREYVIPDFRPGFDTCQIALRLAHVEVMHWQGPAGTVVCVDDGREQLVVMFLGLQDVPFGDISIAYPSRQGHRDRFESRALTEDDVIPDSVVATPFAAPSGSGALAEFWGFDARNEVVEIMRCPDAAGAAEVTVSPTPDGRDAMVIVDGRAAAILRGAPSASKRNVRMVASADI